MGIALGFVIGTQITVALPGKFYPHYFLYWLPPLAVTLSWIIEEVGGLSMKSAIWIKYSVGIGVVIFIVGHEVPNYKLSSSGWSITKYGEIFLNSEKMGKEIAQLLKTDETFYEWGAESNLYFYSQHHPPSGVFFVWHLYGFPYASSLSTRVVTDLEKTQPELFIIAEPWIKSKDFNGLAPNPVLSWFCTRYVPFSIKGDFILFARRGGKLEERLLKNNEQAERKAIEYGNKLIKRIKAESLIELN